ncbi:MAG: transglutaminase-like domain-containing protein, partial [Gemmatimonadota bacterium]|nr:transglutaminase-like domain-containing protein [Gemmatimonadota bacterium]
MRVEKFTIKDTVHLGFIVFFLLMMGMLVNRYYLLGEAQDLEITTQGMGEVQSEAGWYGIYLNKQKIGYSATTVVRQDSFYISTDRSFMAFTMLGRKQAVNTYARAVTDDKMRLLSFIFTITGKETDFSVRGNVEDKWLNLEITMAGESRTEKVRIEEPPQLPSTVTMLINQRELKAGDRFKTVVFDPTSMSNRPLEIEVAGREEIPHRGEKTEVWHVRQFMAGMKVDSYIDNEGRLLEERSEMGYRLVLEDESMARLGDWKEKGTDIQKLVAVTPEGSLKAPRTLTRLLVKLSGMGENAFGLDGGCQSYESGVLEVRSLEPGPGRTDTLPTVVREVNTGPSAFVQSEHPKLLALIAGLIDLDDSLEEKIRTIVRWLNANIRQKPTFSIPNTLEVLERRSGDCNEYAVLFCSMARAAGIPTRIAMGLVYVDGVFYYHAWNECFLGEWIAVDPIFDQFPADATHLRFLAGDMDRQVEILPLVGRVEIRILDFGS